MTAVLSADTCCTTAIAKVSGADLQVPLVQGGECSYANFDYAASAPALAQVTDRIDELLPTYASVHRGAGYASRISTLTYENARESVARFVNCGRRSGCRLHPEHHRFAEPACAVRPRQHRRPPTSSITQTCCRGTTLVSSPPQTPSKKRSRRLIGELCTKPAALLAITGASNVDR